MDTGEIDLSKLKKPFSNRDIIWRIQASGKDKDAIWARIIASVSSRAIMDRLDDVCGPENWQNTLVKTADGGEICGISIKLRGEWVTKYGISPAEAKEAGQRAGVQWGIGRYLYGLGPVFAMIHEKGRYRGKIRGDAGAKDVSFRWDPPQLPNRALPKSEWVAGETKAVPDEKNESGAREDGD
jgi:hypothetical protein